jgi:hypothetical protein
VGIVQVPLFQTAANLAHIPKHGSVRIKYIDIYTIKGLDTSEDSQSCDILGYDTMQFCRRVPNV